MQDTVEGHRTAPTTLAAIPEPAIAAIDALQRSILLAGARVTAITAPHSGTAAGAIAGMLARNFAASGLRTLLIDVSSPVTAHATAADWRPDQPIPSARIRTGGANGTPDVLAITASRQSRPAFNNIDRLTHAFRDGLGDYAVIVLHLAPVPASSEQHVNPVSLACAADATYLVCTSDETTAGEIEKAKSALETAGVTIAGTLLDASRVNAPGPEMAAVAQRWLPLPGGLRRRVAAYLRTSPLFNDLP